VAVRLQIIGQYPRGYMYPEIVMQAKPPQDFASMLQRKEKFAKEDGQNNK